MSNATIEETSTLTAKGQTTVPKAVRQALGVDVGDRIVFRIEQGRVVLESAEAGHRDPALGAFLKIISTDIERGRGVGDLPQGLIKAMRTLAKGVSVDLDETLEGDVAI